MRTRQEEIRLRVYTSAMALSIKSEEVAGPRMSERLRRLQADAATLPVLDPRSPDEIIGYDPTGLPV